MQIFILRCLTVFLMICYSGGVHSANLDFEKIDVGDALHILAKCLNQNIIIAPEVTGTTSLHLHDRNYQNTFDLILMTHNLFKRNVNDTWFISPKIQVINQKEEEIKVQMLLEESEPLSTRIWEIHYAKADELALLLQDGHHSFLGKRGQIQVDTRTNSICVQDTLRHLIDIQKMISQLDRPIQQVLIKARLASIDQDFERELGLKFNLLNMTSDTKPVNANHFSLAIATLADGARLDLQLAALEQEGHGELISSPSLFTANQQAASIEAGEEIPYQEVSESGGTAINFKKAVLRLKVTPQILPRGKILLELQVNQDRPSNRIVLGVPAISTRQMMTKVLIENGKTIVLGGIYESNQEQNQQQIPFLGKIPLVGWLFKQQNVIKNKRELLIFVTPKIIPAEKTGERLDVKYQT